MAGGGWHLEGPVKFHELLSSETKTTDLVVGCANHTRVMSTDTSTQQSK